MIKKWNNYDESISGWELVGKDMGPNYPEQKLPNTLDKSDTNILLGIDDVLYTFDDFQDMYNIYLKMGGNEDFSEFNKNNLDSILSFLNL
jgi:hypothetical protein